MFRLLHLMGEGSLAVGRLFEAHVNAMRLIMLYGTDTQRATAADHARAGKLFALWVTDAPNANLRMTCRGSVITLSGGKDFCSGAGHADHAVVSAMDEQGSQHLLMLTLQQGEKVLASDRRIHGMRSAVTGKIDFTGCTVDLDARFGASGDYLREPEFSTGAWRSSAVALGGLSALLTSTGQQLITRQRDTDPHQRARHGRIMIAYRTGHLWLSDIAQRIYAQIGSAAEIVACVNLARTVVETGCLDAIQAAQRSLGLSAFIEPNPVERIMRDLATYLRQPAPDEAFDEAVAHFTTHAMPESLA